MPSDKFNTAAEEVKQLSKTPSNDELLELYALYKQATVGDNLTSKPTFDLKGRYKWDAWTKLKGMSQEEAEQKYIEYVEKLKASQ
ncbi:acyl-CoA-binding protein [Rhizopus microsporus var. microsporus]|uniref:Acyl-CoA-binding protein n=2 Tax=Rhizopus microsporus TaxID=58291 RepID=A0A2G4SGR4_RHIZD|nr:acyl-CoA-binding protein [Rhizopus microsporus ATCC 52813]ORE11022.1 acyl-CoA-binding protein [Rhizopus microsporus var. microsporus]PHZ07959.1 acyl-CoA-binding protein [Rhizopus microsporus ATCC 52813]